MTVTERLPVAAVRSLMVLVAVAAAILLPAAVAHAHASVVSTDPADGATLEHEPTDVSLEFNQNIGTPAYVVVSAPNGSHLAKGDPKVVDHTVTQAVAQAGIKGRYTMSYRVVSADGHPVEGTVHYTVRNGRTLTAQEADAQSGEEPESFVHRHRDHLLWGLGGILVAAVLLFWPRRRGDA